MVAGLEDPTEGRILIGDTDITRTRAHQRNVNTVFQSYALFPHMSVFDNVAFGLRRGRQGRQAKAQDASTSSSWATPAPRSPTSSPAACSSASPWPAPWSTVPTLLLDEPLGALDLKLRRQMQIELKRIQQEVGLTFIHVTHDQEEAMTMADSIAVMNGGHLEQLGDPATLYEHPASTFVANFLGQSNLLTARVTGPRGTGCLTPRSTATTCSCRPTRCPTASRTCGWACAREAHARRGRGRNRLTGSVTDASFTASPRSTSCDAVGLRRHGRPAERRLARARLGENVTLSWEPGHEFVLDAAQSEDAGVERVLVDG